MRAQDMKASSEQAEQETLFEWIRWMAPHEPALAVAIHIPNEGKRSRAAGIAATLRAAADRMEEKHDEERV